MKTIKLIVALFIMGSIALAFKSKKQNTKKVEPMTTTKDQGIINTGFFYIKKGEEKNFEKFRNRAHVILEKYGAKIERIIIPEKIIKGDLELPSEIHFAYYPSLEAKEAFDKDPEFLALAQEVKLPMLLDKMYGFVTKNDDFEFYREHGDATKSFGIALIWLKDGKKNAKQFTEYHHEACSILPDFGIHFERFLIPFAAANEALKQPNEIHRVYFDSDDAFQQMASDERMQKLFPKRDASLENLIFIQGKSI